MILNSKFDHDQIATLFRNGMTAEQIAVHVGCDITTSRSVLR